MKKLKWILISAGLVTVLGIFLVGYLAIQIISGAARWIETTQAGAQFNLGQVQWGPCVEQAINTTAQDWPRWIVGDWVSSVQQVQQACLQGASRDASSIEKEAPEPESGTY